MKNLLPITLTTVIFSVFLTTNLPLFAQTLVSHQTKDNTNLLLAQKTAETKTANYTGIVKQINDIAQGISVKIHYLNQDETANGSGVIIAKEGNTYSVLTACYIVTNGKPCKSENLLPTLSLTLPDGKKQEIKLTQENVILPNPGVDLAIIRFQSNNDYPVATLGDYLPQGNQWLFVAGFSNQNPSNSLTLTAGTAEDYYASPFKVRDEYSLNNGMDLIYTNLSEPGMGGGAILDTEGNVIGLNLASENTFMAEGNQVQEVRLGYSLGMSTKSILAILKQADVSTNNFKISANLAKSVESSQVDTIRSQLITFQVPNQDATASDWINYGNSLWRDKQYAKAVQAFDQAISLLGTRTKGESLANVYVAKGKALADQGNYQEALIAFQSATKAFPQSPEAWRLQGLMLANLGQYSEALVAYDQAISQSRQNFILDFELADILEKLGRDQEALNIYNKGMGLYSHNFPLIYNKRGIFYAKHGEWNLALQDYNQAIKLDLNFAEAYFNRAVAYYQLQQPDLAMNSYNQAVKLDAKFAEVTYNQVPTFYKQNIWD
jgi:tetratricopeptide (TPR) repeat protein